MNGRTHKCGGVALAATVAVALGGYKGVSIEQGIMLITGATFGALLPDIDHKGSEVGRKLKPISKVICKHTEHRGFTHTLVFTAIVAMILFGSMELLKNSYKGDLTSRVILGAVSGFLIWIALDTALNSMRPKFIHKKKIKKLLDLDYPSLVILIILCTTFSAIVYNTLDMFAYGVIIGCISHIILDLFNPMGVPILYPLSKHRIHIANIKTGEQEGLISLICNIITLAAIFKYFN